jgi:hypothetical protein
MSVASQSLSPRTKDEGCPVARCRDKHQQVLSSSTLSYNSDLPLPPAISMDLRDPFKIISLAIKYDENMNDEEILCVPLESGSLYNHRLFTAGLDFLQMRTEKSNTFDSWWRSLYKRKTSMRPCSKELLSKTTSNSNKTQQQPHERVTKTALTPIILSGLLSDYSCNHYISSICSNHHHCNTMRNFLNSTTTTSTELVYYTQQMRRAALARVKLRRERYRVQCIVTPIIITGLLGCLYLYAMRKFLFIFQEYGFVDDSCERLLPGWDKIGYTLSTAKPSIEKLYQNVCRESEAFAWKKLHQIQPYLSVLEDCTAVDCPLAETLAELFHLYTMHTQLQEANIPLEDILGRQRILKQMQRSTSAHDPIRDQKYVSGMPVKWLGDSLINRLVREAIMATHKNTARSKTESFSLLDAGSGLSGLLFSLLDLPFGGWNYLGITISQPEVRLTNHLLDLHQIFPGSISGSLRNVTIQTANFDDPLPSQSFHTIVAIESLRYSQNISKTIANLAAALKPNGSLIIVEDVLAPWTKDIVEIQKMVELTSKRSLLTHQDWVESISSAGLMFQLAARDLSLEYDWMYPPHSDDPFYEFALHLSDRLSQWFGRIRNDGSSNYGTSARVIRFLSALIQHSSGNYLRQLSYHRAELTLMMYTCTKK